MLRLRLRLLRIILARRTAFPLLWPYFPALGPCPAPGCVFQADRRRHAESRGDFFRLFVVVDPGLERLTLLGGVHRRAHLVSGEADFLPSCPSMTLQAILESFGTAFRLTSSLSAASRCALPRTS